MDECIFYRLVLGTSMPETVRIGQEDEDRLDRSRRLGWLDVDRIGMARFLVVGAGALGNEVIKDLVLSGARHVVLVDMDRVVRSNLNRCVFFREEDARLGLDKATVVARRARELDPDVEIDAVVRRIQDLPSTTFEEVDIIFGCLDNVAARMHVNAEAYRSSTPYIDGGTSGALGKVQVVIPPGPCLQCATNATHSKVLERRFSCTGSDVSYFEPKLAAEITTTSVIAAIQVREGLKLLSGAGDRCLAGMLFYDGLNNRTEVFEVQLDESCPVHPRHSA
ncbi:MAG: ThiF family adenylyltransferase [Methanomassiliicoccales archaeon]|nr:ThiF family adenylyltransferase [Methanomassiliicoccales archaeon]